MKNLDFQNPLKAIGSISGINQMKIPFNKPSFTGREIEYIEDAISRGHTSGDGAYTAKCSSLLQDIFQTKKILMTTSCTHSLEMTAILLDIKPGDEIILPSFTFVSTVNAFVLRGALPVFADIRSDTLNIDETRIEKLITKKTKAIIVVHYAGVGCEMDSIMQISENYSIPVIEDNAHGLFGKYKDNYLGKYGVMATQSFHETKNFNCGEGGALIINESSFIERAEIIREKGTDRSKYFRGEIDKYSWVDIGSSYLMSDILAAYLYAQLQNRKKIQLKRKKIWDKYNNQLREWATINNIRMPFVPEECSQTYHMYYLIMPSSEMRNKLLEYLNNNGIMAVFHYLPLHLSHMGKKYGSKHGDCPVTEDLSNRLIRLPLYNDLDINMINFECFYDFKG